MKGLQVAGIGDTTIYRMMADETKLTILKILSGESKCVNDLIAITGISQTLMSHKLRELRENGLVISERSGRRIIYSLSSSSITKLLNLGQEIGTSIPARCECVECEEQEE